MKQVALALYPVSLPHDLQLLQLAGKNADAGIWIQQINLSGSKKLQEWNKETAEKGDYRLGQETIRLNGKLPMGAYVIEASSGSVVARDLLLVTDTALILKASGKQALAYFCNALSGAPLAGARVKLGEHRYDGAKWVWRESVKETNQDGIALFDLIDRDAGRNNHIGQAALFRLEEYKLPEFQVSVQTPEENGRKKSFRLGDRVEVNVQADYYFGAPVANATVEILVHQNPFHHWWHPQRDFEWYYEDLLPQHWYGGRRGQIIKREKVRTDGAGRATLAFDTPREVQQDFEYYVEARVTDSSRREIIGGGSVRVTRQRYYVYPRAKHSLHRPQDKVAIDLKALDANDQPMQVEGTVKVTRDTWDEIWLDPSRREVKGAELKKLREKGAFPPPDSAGWRLEFRGYQSDEVLTQAVKTNAEGESEISFTPGREGYYRVEWSSPDKGAAPIKAGTAVWITTNATTELGYRQGGLEIIVDQDTFRAGRKAPVMLHAPAPDRYVLFSVESEDLHSYQLVHLTGTVKLIEVPLEERHTPNIFLSAAMVSDRQIFTDTKWSVISSFTNTASRNWSPDPASCAAMTSPSNSIYRKSEITKRPGSQFKSRRAWP